MVLSIWETKKNKHRSDTDPPRVPLWICTRSFRGMTSHAISWQARMIWIDSKNIYFPVNILLLDVDIEIRGVYSPSFAVRKTANVFTRR